MPILGAAQPQQYGAPGANNNLLGANGGGIQQMGGGGNPYTQYGLIPGLIGNLLGGGPSDPYQDAMDQMRKYEQKAAGMQNPFWQAGTGAIPQYQAWLKTMQDPTKFINQTMGQYQQSPWARFQTDQAMRANTNAASASGLIGSTPYQQAGEQYARDISSQDMNTWLGNVMGINTMYGQGLNNMMGMGQHAADAMTNFYGQMLDPMGIAAYGRSGANEQNMWNMMGGIGQMAGMLGGL